MPQTDHALRNWVMGIGGSLITAAILGAGGLLFTLSGDVAALEATQDHLVTQINRLLDVLTQERQ